jgi:hypothetical protein
VLHQTAFEEASDLLVDIVVRGQLARYVARRGFRGLITAEVAISFRLRGARREYWSGAGRRMSDQAIPM